MAARALPAAPYRVTSIVGTRPEAIKMQPVVRALAHRPGIAQRVMLTGQHRGLEHSFDCLPAAAIGSLSLDLRALDFGALRDRLRAAIAAAIVASPPDVVIVQGDTTSALAGALAARDCGIPIAHVEAGLRSFDPVEPWPEEGNRIEIDAMADLLFAPTPRAAANLAAEAAVAGQVHVTGNSGIDALFHADGTPPTTVRRARRRILVTVHRKENQGPALARIAEGLRRLVAELPVDIVFPLHPNRHLRASVEALLAGVPHIRLIDPVDHRQMVRLIRESWLILTDSGGLQEEGPALGTPVLVLRNVTERCEAGAGVRLVGTDPAALVREVHGLLLDEVLYARMAQPSFPFGDGRAAPRIVAHLEDWLAARVRR